MANQNLDKQAEPDKTQKQSSELDQLPADPLIVDNIPLEPLVSLAVSAVEAVDDYETNLEHLTSSRASTLFGDAFMALCRVRTAWQKNKLDCGHLRSNTADNRLSALSGIRLVSDRLLKSIHEAKISFATDAEWFHFGKSDLAELRVFAKKLSRLDVEDHPNFQNIPTKFYALPTVELGTPIPLGYPEIHQESLHLLAAIAVFEDCIFCSIHGPREYPNGEQIKVLAFYVARLNAVPQHRRFCYRHNAPVEFSNQRWSTYHDAAFGLAGERFSNLYNQVTKEGSFPIEKLAEEDTLARFVLQVVPQFSRIRNTWSLPRINIDELGQLIKWEYGLWQQGPVIFESDPHNLQAGESETILVGTARDFSDRSSEADEEPPLEAGPTKSATVGNSPAADVEQNNKPSYLGLIVDNENQTVRRVNYDPVVKLHRPILWHTFRIFYEAGDSEATLDAWINGYPGEWDARHTNVANLRNELIPLGITVESRKRRLITT